MKVKVNIKRAMQEENERLFQENKDLRVEVAHAKDEIAILKKQLHEREEQACDDYTKVFEELRQLKPRYATVCAERDNLQAAFRQMTGWWETAISEKNNAQIKLHSAQNELADRDERVFILEQRIGMLEEENEEWRNTAEQLSAKVVSQNTEINRVTEDAYNLSQRNIELEMTVTEWMNKYSELEKRSSDSSIWEIMRNGLDEIKKEIEKYENEH